MIFWIRKYFYGPAATKDKKTIEIDEYDYVILTNNAISFFF